MGYYVVCFAYLDLGSLPEVEFLVGNNHGRFLALRSQLLHPDLQRLGPQDRVDEGSCEEHASE